MTSRQCYWPVGHMATRYTDTKDAHDIGISTFPEKTISLPDIKLQNQSAYPSFSQMSLVT
jgi:hypothetical protein